MRRVMFLAAASLLTIGMAACGSDKDESPSTTPGTDVSSTVAGTGGETPDTQEIIDDQSPGEGGDGLGENNMPAPES